MRRPRSTLLPACGREKCGAGVGACKAWQAAFGQPAAVQQVAAVAMALPCPCTPSPSRFAGTAALLPCLHHDQPAAVVRRHCLVELVAEEGLAFERHVAVQVGRGAAQQGNVDLGWWLHQRKGSGWENEWRWMQCVSERSGGLPPPHLPHERCAAALLCPACQPIALLRRQQTLDPKPCCPLGTWYHSSSLPPSCTTFTTSRVVRLFSLPPCSTRVPFAAGLLLNKWYSVRAGCVW